MSDSKELVTNLGKAWKGSGMLKAPAGNPTFSWLEDYYGGRYAKVSGTTTAATDQTATVTGAGTNSGYIFTAGDIIRNGRTGEIIVVGTVAATTIQLHVRAFGSTAAAAMADGDSLFIIGNVNEENSGARNVNTTRTSKQENYTQIFKTTIAVSGTENQADLYGGKDIPYQRAKKGTEHALDIERAFWWGEKNSSTGGNGHPMRSTGGVLEFIQTGQAYVQNQGGALSAPDFNTFLREGFTYGSDSKWLFAGGVVMQAITEFSRGQLRTEIGQTTYGLSVSQYVTPFGTINLVHNPLFVQDYA